MPHHLRSLVVAIIAAFTLPACANELDPSTEDADIGETAEALSTSSCKLSRAAILASVTGGRRTAIERGFGWYDADVPYSQSSSYRGYRTDCSGFVSMCWQLDSSYTTADFSTGGGDSSLLGAYSKLVPGDALVRRSNGAGHIVLFLGWSDAAHSAACVLEQANTASDMQFRARSTDSLVSGGYKAVRADKLPAAAGGSPAAPGPAPDDATDDTAAAPTGAGAAPNATPAPAGSGKRCANTGSCNPGNDGSGLICVAGTCQPGCITDAQCPGIKRCVSRQCR